MKALVVHMKFSSSSLPFPTWALSSTHQLLSSFTHSEAPFPSKRLWEEGGSTIMPQDQVEEGAAHVV